MNTNHSQSIKDGSSPCDVNSSFCTSSLVLWQLLFWVLVCKRPENGLLNYQLMLAWLANKSTRTVKRASSVIKLAQVGRWLALLPHISCIWIHCGVFSMDILHVLPRNSSLFPQFKDMHGVRLIGDTKLGVGVSPVTNWWPVLAVLGLSSYESWDRLQPTCNSEFDKQEKVDGWIDGWDGLCLDL